MSRVLCLEARPLPQVRHNPDFPKQQFDHECSQLCNWLMQDLVDILERHLLLDLSALRKIAYPLASRQELRDDYEMSDDEIRELLAAGRQERNAAWQVPDLLISSILSLLHKLEPQHINFPSDLLLALTNHPEGLMWYGEEAYFSNGQFGAELEVLLKMATNARAHQARAVRIVVEDW